ncbi:MAG: hypothetical protein K6G62_07075 [Eubacterium sp.]|nr:hypothetical protein [Eubacterium sp.]
MQGISAKKRVCALLAMIMIATILIFSLVYVAENAEHDCCGHHCPICEMIEQCLHNLELVGGAVFTVTILVGFLQVARLALAPESNPVFARTLVAQKVRMDN